MSGIRRRQFLQAGSVGLGAGLLPGLARGAAAPMAFPSTDSTRVRMTGDGLGLTPSEQGRLIARLADEGRIARDNYSNGGVVGELEERFAAILGKERAVFMPTGTLANQLAVRALAGPGGGRAVVQAEAHLYNDSGDCVQTLSQIPMIPLAPGAATFTLDQVREVVERTAGGRVVRPVSVISIESPVRRRSGEIFDPAELAQITAYARSEGIRLHLDGARMFLESACAGVDVAELARPFDTVYVSLYKYFNAASGAILAGPRSLLDGMFHTRRMFGGGLPSAWPFAAVALHHLPGFTGRFANAVAVSEEFINRVSGPRGVHRRADSPGHQSVPPSGGHRRSRAIPGPTRRGRGGPRLTAERRRLPPRRERDVEPRDPGRPRLPLPGGSRVTATHPQETPRMQFSRPRLPALAGLALTLLAGPAAAQDLETLRPVSDQGAAERAKLAQVIVDSLFSFGELGFQEVETARFLGELLRENGFEVEEGIAGIPTAWMARWGEGSPVIALGSDVDGIPKASQKPGVAYHEPMVEGAPGHGEGHNSGLAVVIVGALAAKEIMEREDIPGTIVIWPGVAEELLASKAWFVRAGYFDDMDVNIFTHVASDFGVSWGQGRGSGLVSVEYTFRGESAHSAGAPWRGRSALDAVEIMNTGWNFKREHLRLPHRSHYVIPNGGDQPNVVPQLASVWYYLRELDQPHMKELYELGNTMATAAAAMTSTEVSWRILGHAYPRHFNKPVAEAVWANIERVGLPEWSEADQALARGLQRELGVAERGLTMELGEMGGPAPEPRLGGFSDDIGDITWKVPTVTLRYPANIPGGPGHHWANAVAMATPIAHKGVTAAARVIAMTLMDLVLDPSLIAAAKEYFAEQTAEHEYTSLLGPDDPPPIHLNREKQAAFREAMRPFYYDPDRYGTYLEQLGIEYPTVREPQN